MGNYEVIHRVKSLGEYEIKGKNPNAIFFFSVKPFKPHVLAFNESLGSIGTFPICKLI